MKNAFPVLLALLGLASPTWAQSPSPAGSVAAPATGTGTAAARTDIYHVHFEKAALGKAADAADFAKKQDPDAPMPGHYIVLRHQDGDDWDYCVIEHLGPKASVEATRPAPPANQTALTDWHTDTFVSGPAWATFAKEMGVDDASKSSASAYVVAVYRPAAGQREGLDKFLNEPPDRTIDTSSGNVVLQHMEGAAWTFMAISRFNSWADFAKNEVNSIGQLAKKDAGWFKLRSLMSYHTDTLCDRLAP
ncbi:MAG TPA: hypothetical protein VK474_08405 [Chthoniobacterales bacterium]|nr:hypothetical protein [Chthoniobacterales bacterium]